MEFRIFALALCDSSSTKNRSLDSFDYMHFPARCIPTKDFSTQTERPTSQFRIDQLPSNFDPETSSVPLSKASYRHNFFQVRFKRKSTCSFSFSDRSLHLQL